MELFVPLFTIGVMSLLLVLTGRWLVVHFSTEAALLSPVACLLVGAGVWLAWAVGVQAWGGISLDVSLGLFSVVVVLLSAGMFRTFRHQGDAEHFWTQTAVGLVLLSPAILVLCQYQPLTVLDLTRLAPPVLASVQQNTLAAVSDFASIWLLQVPLHFPSQFSLHFEQVLPHPIGLVLLPVLALIGAAGAMIQAAGMRIRWSNLPLITTGSLLAVSVLNPGFSVNLVQSGTPDLLIALVIILLVLPLLTGAHPPVGMAVFPSAVLAGWLALTHPAVWPILAMIWLAWLVRGVSLWRQQPLDVVVSLAILALWPLVMVLAWQTAHGPLDGTIWLPVQAGWRRVLLALLALGIVGFTLWRLLHVPLTWGDWYHWQQRRVAVWVPTVLCGALLWQEYTDYRQIFTVLSWLQFVLLVPLWRWALQWYQTSPTGKLMYQAPWVYGVTLALLTFALVQALSPQLSAPLPVAQQHAQQVAHALRNQPDIRTLAVLAEHPVAVARLQYAVAGRQQVLDAAPLWLHSGGDRAQFHAQLRQLGADALWLHMITPGVQTSLQRSLAPQHSYLFALAEQRYQLLETFPHQHYRADGRTDVWETIR